MNDQIVFQNVNQSYGSKPVLKDLNLTIPAGRIVGLLGPNGSGKSTMLKMLSGLITDFSGSLTILGTPVGEATKGMVSFLPDKMYFANRVTPREAIETSGTFFEDFDISKAHELLRAFSLDETQPVGQMSKGMQEKFQLALAMSRQTKLYLLDEPLGGVDPATRAGILDLIKSSYSENSTLIISTHLVHDIEPIFNYCVMLGFRELLLAGETSDIYSYYGKSMEQLFKEVYACLGNF